MVRNVDQDGLLEFICNRIVPAFDPLRIILFGSRARGDARPDSDIDLVVVFDHVDDKRARAIDIRRVLRDLPVGNDVIVTTPEEIRRRGDVIGLLRPALREGHTLYERN